MIATSASIFICRSINRVTDLEYKAADTAHGKLVWASRGRTEQELSDTFQPPQTSEINHRPKKEQKKQSPAGHLSFPGDDQF